LRSAVDNGSCLARLVAVLVTSLAVSVVWVSEASADPVVYSAGDIACAPGSKVTSTQCRQVYTSNIVVNGGATKAVAVGDLQYDSATLSNLQNSYDKSWGRFKSITRPALGNHEGSGAGYFDYWNGVGVNDGVAGQRGKGWYSFDVGAWHLVALNSNCSSVGCNKGSTQETWLKNDLAAHPTACALAFWHHPRFSSGHDGNNTFMQDLWQDLYNAHVDVTLVGHSHDYERFAPLDASGKKDTSNGIREFVVGTGGAFFTGWTTIQPNSEVRQNNTYGVMKLTLHPTSYDWKFVPESGKSFTDTGSEACRGGGSSSGDTQAPSVPGNLNAAASSSTSVALNWGASTDNLGVAGYEVFRNGSLLATVAGLSYTDNSVSAGSTYSYQVRAFDAAGNRSGFGNTATVTTPAGSGGSTTLTFTPSDDASIYSDTPSANYGSATTVETDNSPVKNFLLKFAVTGVGSKQVTGAKLRLYCVNASAGSGGEFRSTSNVWSQATVTWSSAPAASATVTASLGPVSASRWYEVLLGPLVTGDGVYSVRVNSASSDGADYSSSEGSSSLTPQLVVTAN
jgi:chitodextrinase